MKFDDLHEKFLTLSKAVSILDKENNKWHIVNITQYLEKFPNRLPRLGVLEVLLAHQPGDLLRCLLRRPRALQQLLRGSGPDVLVPQGAGDPD